MPPLSAEDFFNTSVDTEASSSNGGMLFAPLQADKTAKKDYRAAYIYINVTSYSQRNYLHDCARLFQIYKTPTVGSAGSDGGSSPIPNLHFVFGHAIGAGFQTFIVTGNKQAALFATFLGWKADYEAGEGTAIAKKGKTAPLAALAVEKLCNWWQTTMAPEWEIAMFNGKPASELTFFLDTENGYYHAGHIDIVVRNKRTGRYMVIEIKTTSIRTVDEAMYGNSEQPLGYSLVLDKIADDLRASANFEVLYVTYSTTAREIFAFPFTKNRQERIEWLQDLLVDHTLISTYKNLSYFPKRGDSCWSFGGRCEYYGMCDLATFKGRTDRFKTFDRSTMALPEPVDFEFTLKEITASVMRDKLEPTHAAG